MAGAARALGGLLLLLTLLLGARLAVAQGADAECITLDDFSQSKVGEFPGDWKARKD